MALSKGVILLGGMEFVRKRYGEEALARVLAEMDPADASLMKHAVAAGWYPIEPFLRFRRTVDRIFGKGDLALLREMGRFAGDFQLHTVLKSLLKLTNPSWLVERGTRVWRQYHDTGDWEYIRSEPNYLRARITGFVADEAWCTGFLGFIERAVELTGGKDPKAVHPRCRARGDAFCEFEGRWG